MKSKVLYDLEPLYCSVMTDYKLDDRYKEGVYYDSMNGDFCKIQDSVDGELVELVNPETDEVYWDMDVREWIERKQQDFIKVPEDAVNDPLNVINTAIHKLRRNDPNELMSLSEKFSIKVRYAHEQVDIQEI